MQLAPEIMQNFWTSLLIMAQGMEGIFVIIALIAFIVWGLSKVK